MAAEKKLKETGEGTKFRRLFHVGICAFSIVCVLYGSICTLVHWNDPKYINLQFMQHGYDHVQYFLSLWVVGSNILYYHLYAAIEIVEVYYNNNKNLLKLADNIHRIASYLLFTIVFPMSLYVLIAFWTLYTYYRDSMYPPLMDEIMPPWINHCLHTAPVPLSIMYMFISNRHVPSKQSTISGIVAFLSFYWGLFLMIRFVKGTWVYMVMYEFTTFQTFMFISASMIVPVFFVHLGFKVNSKLKVLRSHIVPLLSNS